jgi:hypothetical protein
MLNEFRIVLAAVISTIVCDAIGNSYSLSDLTELSENQIPYPEQLAICWVISRN